MDLVCGLLAASVCVVYLAFALSTDQDEIRQDVGTTDKAVAKTCTTSRKKYNIERQRELQEDLARNIIQNRSIRSEIDHILGYKEVNMLFLKTNSLAHFMNCMISFSAKEELWTVAYGVHTELWDKVMHSPLEKRDLSYAAPMNRVEHDEEVGKRNKKRREEFLDREIPRH